MSIIGEYQSQQLAAKDAKIARLTRLLAEASVALSPFDAFADKASSFVNAAAGAANDASPVMPTRHFRLSDFQRARDVSAKIEEALQRAALKGNGEG